MTGMWTNEPPDDESPAMPLSGLLMARRGEHQAGVLETSLARARAQEARELRAEAAAAIDPDERAAGLIARGVMPGQVSQLSQRLGDTLAELQGEREKIEKGQRRAEQMRRAHERGQVSALDIARMDFDEGDEAKVARLERRADNLRRQLAEAAALIAPERQAPEDPLQAATRRAHDAFIEVTRQRIAEAAARTGEPRPFAGAGLSAADAAECTGPDCPVCTAYRAARGGDPNGYAPGAVITTGYEAVR